jgi:hypothetical protein
VARFLADALNQAVQAGAWERDQEAWNLPRPPGEPIPRRAHKDEHDAGESDPGEQAAEPPAMAPGRTE